MIWELDLDPTVVLGVKVVETSSRRLAIDQDVVIANVEALKSQGVS